MTLTVDVPLFTSGWNVCVAFAVEEKFNLYFTFLQSSWCGTFRTPILMTVGQSHPATNNGVWLRKRMPGVGNKHTILMFQRYTNSALLCNACCVSSCVTRPGCTELDMLLCGGTRECVKHKQLRLQMELPNVWAYHCQNTKVFKTHSFQYTLTGPFNWFFQDAGNGFHEFIVQYFTVLTFRSKMSISSTRRIIYSIL